MNRSFQIGVVLGVAVTGAGAAAGADRAADGHRAGATVVWINLDGLRWDYTDRTEMPTFDRLMREGAFTRALAPAFPTLTFPTHVSMVTGVPVSEHGIAANGYYDRRSGQVLRYPPEAALLDAEPIWITAERQGVRAAVFDWPVSHRQEGDVTASYFNMGYNPRMPDEPRLFQPLEAWADDEDERPLRLLMGYATATDSPGHRYGPDAPEMSEVIRETDALVGRFLERMLDIASEKLADDEDLYLVITTDHGMSTVHHAVHAGKLLAIEDRDDIRVVTSGNIANVYLTGIEPEAERRRVAAELVARAGSHHFAAAYRLGEVPERLGYAHPDTVGDVVVILDRGYIFSSRPDSMIVDIAEIGGPLGMHGYDVETNPDMYGLSLVWRRGRALGGIDLGRVDYRSLHPTVAALLGVDPSPSARGEALRLEPIAEPAAAR
ncbi:MAG: alkaline phosphatase family protein [Phycisphaerales bacterium]|nr:alkaline phosphatase family protein [Planctomycetota bacterium]MCH8508950.1 alkaline phosphatase family protein [Phycisphaerales bacterium]